MNDPIADMLSRLRNAIMVGKNTVRMPHSKIKAQLLERLKEDGFITEVTKNTEEKFPELIVTIHEPGTPCKISGLERVSKPGRRYYAKANEIPRVMNGRGVMILSTSQGIMADHTARDKGVGGEVMVKVW